MKTLEHKFTYEVIVTREYFDLDKETKSEVVCSESSANKAFVKVAKIVKEIFRDGFKPYSCAMYALCFDNGWAEDYMSVEIRVRVTGSVEGDVPISYGMVGKYLSQELFDKLLNSHIEFIKDVAEKE